VEWRDRTDLVAAHGLDRVGRAWRDKPILSAEQIEDIVADLENLRD